MEQAALERLGSQAMILVDGSGKVVSVPVIMKVTEAGIIKYGFTKVPGLWIQVIIWFCQSCCNIRVNFPSRDYYFLEPCLCKQQI